MIGWLRRRARHLRRDAIAAVTVQFVVALPIVIYCFTFATDFGMAMTRSAMLERALDLESRAVRIGQRAPDDYDGIRRGICQRARLIPDCLSRVKLEVRAMSPSRWEPLSASPDCESLSEVTVTAPSNFDSAQSNQLVLIRACVVFEAISPGGGFAQAVMSTGAGGFNRYYQLTATNSYVMEP